MAVSRDKTRQNYDRLSRWYDLFTGNEKKFTESGLKVLDVKEGETVLEIGFGTGHSLVAIAHQVGNSGLAVGVEVSPGIISVARKRMSPLEDKLAEGPESCAKIVQGDGTFLPFAPDSFDAAFLSFTLELFSDVEILVVLRECHRVLKAEGRLGVVSLAKGDTLAGRLYQWGHEQWPVLLDCQPINLKECLEAGGFHVKAAKSQTMWGLAVEIASARLF